MKVSEALFLLAAIVIASLLSYSLFEAAGRMVSDFDEQLQRDRQVIEERNAVLHDYMFPAEPIGVYITSNDVQSDHEHYIVTRPDYEPVR